MYCTSIHQWESRGLWASNRLDTRTAVKTGPRLHNTHHQYGVPQARTSGDGRVTCGGARGCPSCVCVPFLSSDEARGRSPAVPRRVVIARGSRTVTGRSFRPREISNPLSSAVWSERFARNGLISMHMGAAHTHARARGAFFQKAGPYLASEAC